MCAGWEGGDGGGALQGQFGATPGSMLPQTETSLMFSGFSGFHDWSVWGNGAAIVIVLVCPSKSCLKFSDTF
jgi:hypothetical protein